MRARAYATIIIVVLAGLAGIYALGARYRPPVEQHPAAPPAAAADSAAWGLHVIQWLLLYDSGQYEASQRYLESAVNSRENVAPGTRETADQVSKIIARHIAEREERRRTAVAALDEAQRRLDAGELRKAAEFLRAAARVKDILDETERHRLARAQDDLDRRRLEKGQDLLRRYEAAVRAMNGGDAARGRGELQALAVEAQQVDEIIAVRIQSLLGGEAAGTAAGAQAALREAARLYEARDYHAARKLFAALQQDPGNLALDQRGEVNRYLDKIAALGQPRIEMIVVPGGAFTMGADGGSPAEAPPHKVAVKPFRIGKFEVTNAEYKEFLDAVRYDKTRAFAHPDTPPGWDFTPAGDKPEAAPYAWKDGAYPPGTAKRPVVLVSWYDAWAYAHWRGMRLPTEAEWECAARGSDGRAYPWGDKFDPERCNSYETPPDGPADVGSYPEGAAACGALDMAGNVWEWCGDFYSEDYYRRPEAAVNPRGPETGGERVVRGGSWSTTRGGVRCTTRRSLTPAARDINVGIRLAADAE